MNLRKFLLFLPLFFLLTACNDPLVVEKYSEVVQEAVYGTSDALQAGRIDLAEQYIDNLETIIPIPTKRIVITPVIYNGVRYVVLNDRETNSKVVVVGSSDFNNLLKLKQINQQEQKDANNFQKQAQQQASIDAQQISALHAAYNQVVQEKQDLENADNAKIAAIQKQSDTYKADWQGTIEYKIESFFTISLFTTPVIIGGIIALCVFCPTAVPIVFETIGTIGGLIVRIVGFGVTIVSNIVSYIIPKSSVISPSPIPVVAPTIKPLSYQPTIKSIWPFSITKCFECHGLSSFRFHSQGIKAFFVDL